MKGTKNWHISASWGIGATCVALVLMIPSAAPLMAQGEPSAAEPQQAPEQPPLLSPQQLDDMVAPIALYPDPLLSQTLVACTYPLEIVEASEWLQQNGRLQGADLTAAARQQNWDPSVQALVVFPDVLNRLASNIRWTTDLGNAFLAQQADVMNAVQTMRQRAQAAGKLDSNAQENVVDQTQGDQTAIEIQPANPQVIYVPQYNPEYIWGPPVWGYYPPLYYPTFGFGFGPGIYCGGFFGGLGWGGWGWGPNWFGGGIFLNFGFFNHYGYRGGFYGGGYGGYRGGYGGRGLWAHDPVHRMGVPYSNRAVASRFGGSYGTRGAGGSFGNRGTLGAAGGGSRFGAAGANRMGSQGSGAARSFGPQGTRPAAGGGQWNHFGASPSAGNPAGGGFRSAPSYGGRAYGGGSTPAYRQSPGSTGGGFRAAPSYNRGYSGGGAVGSAPAYRGSSSGGGFRSAPSGGGNFRSAPSVGGGGFRSAPSGGGNFRSAPSGGSSHGGGGGGGFHGGGGGGGSHSSGGGHGGRR